MREIHVRIPVPRGLASNLAGLFGLLAATLAIGGLAGNWWWSVLAGGVVCAGLAVLAQWSEPAEPTEPTEPPRPIRRTAA